MCGIIGYVGPKPTVEILIDGLKRLEYRGYDSAGLAVVRDGTLRVLRSPRKLSNPERQLSGAELDGSYGLGHTRWATHGRPNEENAHPHRDCTGSLVVVHNGIVENYLDLKGQLSSEGHRFVTETDTDVIAHLLEKHWKTNLEQAVFDALKELKGVYAFAALSAKDPDKLVAARNGPPLVVGLGEDETEAFIASDVPAFLSHSRNAVFLDDGEVAVIRPGKLSLFDGEGRPRDRAPTRITWDPVQVEKQGFKHFMLKEIHEQPRTIRDTRLGRGLHPGTPEDHPHRLRHQLACRAGRQVSHGGERPPARTSRRRLGVPIPNPGSRERGPGGGNQPIRGDGRYPGRASRRGGDWCHHPRHLQRHGEYDHPHHQRHPIHPRRSGNRSRLHQVLRRAAGRPPSTRPLLGSGSPLPDRARGRAEAQGAFLHSRRGIPRRRDEAWPHRTHRRTHAGGGAGAFRFPFRQDGQQYSRGQGARGTHHRLRLGRRVPAEADPGRGLRSVDPASTSPRGHLAPGGSGAASTSRLLHRRRPRL